MKAKFSLLFMVTCMGAGSALAQVQTFDLALYKNPFYKRSQLDFTMNLNGNNYWNKGNNSYELYNYSLSSFTGLLNGTYSQILNSQTVQRTRQFSLNENPMFNKSKSDDSYSNKTFKENKNNLDFSIFSSDRFYKNNQTFFEITVDANAGHSADYSATTEYLHATDSLINSTLYDGNQINANGTVGFRYGKGRIEYVEDARLAVYILDDLQKHNRLAHEPTTDEIMEFAKVITQVKNRRFFDTRLRQIEEITVVDSFLTASHLASSHDAAYFTTVNDNWNNAAGPGRSAGFRYSVGISPEFSWARIHNEGVSASTDRAIGASGDLLLDYYKPINLYWQMDGGLDLKYSLLRSRYYNGISANSNVNRFDASFWGRIGYYPNSRSSYSASLSLQYADEYRKFLDIPNNVGITKSKYQNIVPLFTLSGYYYVSAQLRLQLNYKVTYYNPWEDYYTGQYTSSKNWGQSLIIQLTYSLF